MIIQTALEEDYGLKEAFATYNQIAIEQSTDHLKAICNRMSHTRPVLRIFTGGGQSH